MLSKAFLSSMHLKENSTNRFYSYGVLVSVYLQAFERPAGISESPSAANIKFSALQSERVVTCTNPFTI